LAFKPISINQSCTVLKTHNPKCDGVVPQESWSCIFYTFYRGIFWVIYLGFWVLWLGFLYLRIILGWGGSSGELILYLLYLLPGYLLGNISWVFGSLGWVSLSWAPYGLVILPYLDLRCISRADTGRRQGYGILIDVFGSLGWVSLSWAPYGLVILPYLELRCISRAGRGRRQFTVWLLSVILTLDVFFGLDQGKARGCLHYHYFWWP